MSGGTPGTVLYVYDEAGHLLGEYSSTGALVQETIWMGDIPVATLRPGTPAVIYYVHTDHLNTPRRVSRPSDNKLMWTWYSDAFGLDLPNENPASGGTFKYNLRFPGQLYDSQAGILQNYFRDYDPAIGRYVESDPIGLGGGLGTYSYVENRPSALVDPTGLAPTSPPSFYLKECETKHWKECEERCSPNRVLRCKRRFDRKLAHAPGGNLIFNYVEGKLQCECDDKFCSRNPKTCAAATVAVILGIVVTVCVAPEAAPALALP